MLKVENGNYELNEDFIFKVSENQTNRSKQEPMYSDAFLNKIGFLRRKTDPYEEKHFNLAASAQKRLNEAAISLIKWLHKETGSSNLCIAGGVGLNCIMNQSLLALDEVDNIFIQPAASDAGTSLGAAYEIAIQEGEKLKSYPGAYTGNEFTESTMKAEIENLGVKYREVSNPAELAAKMIADGKIIGWFQGRHEFGPRALGSRSILADTRNADMKDLINVRIKFREEFRPFAPSVLEEEAHNYFDTNGHPFPHMTVTNNVCSDHQNDIPAVVHEDKTSRIQTVNSNSHPLYHELISHFNKLTGVPVVVNTSFNVRGQAIVNTPTHAVGTLFGSGMDMAFIGPFLIEK